MLVLTRKNQEAVIVRPSQCLKQPLKVTVLEIKKGSVKLGFEAEKECAVHRWEVWQQIRDNGPTHVRQNITTAR